MHTTAAGGNDDNYNWEGRAGEDGRRICSRGAHRKTIDKLAPGDRYHSLHVTVKLIAPIAGTERGGGMTRWGELGSAEE